MCFILLITTTAPCRGGVQVTTVLESYRFACRKGTPILNKLEIVRQRGRKRDMFG